MSEALRKGGKKNLVIESTGSSRRKKRGGLDVFQFAETVEPEAWGDRARDLQVRPLLSHVHLSSSITLSFSSSRTVSLPLSENKC